MNRIDLACVAFDHLWLPVWLLPLLLACVFWPVWSILS